MIDTPQNSVFPQGLSISINETPSLASKYASCCGIFCCRAYLYCCRRQYMSTFTAHIFPGNNNYVPGFTHIFSPATIIMFRVLRTYFPRRRYTPQQLPVSAKRARDRDRDRERQPDRQTGRIFNKCISDDTITKLQLYFEIEQKQPCRNS